LAFFIRPVLVTAGQVLASVCTGLPLSCKRKVVAYDWPLATLGAAPNSILRYGGAMTDLNLFVKAVGK
jgi:hypothetical protein